MLWVGEPEDSPGRISAATPPSYPSAGCSPALPASVSLGKGLFMWPPLFCQDVSRKKAASLYTIEVSRYLKRMKSYRDLCRDIKVAYRKKNHIGKGVKGSKAASTVLDNLNNPVQPFSCGVGQSASNKCKDSAQMLLERSDKFSNRFDATFQGSGHPAFEKPLRCPRCLVVPEPFKLIA